MLQDFKSVSDHFGTLCIKGLICCVRKNENFTAMDEVLYCSDCSQIAEVCTSLHLSWFTQTGLTLPQALSIVSEFPWYCSMRTCWFEQDPATLARTCVVNI